MSRLTDIMVIGVAGLIAAGGSAVLVREPGFAADHLDPPARTDIRVDPTPDLPADIADIYAFTDATNLNMIMTFAGPLLGTNPANYDPNVRYIFHLSTSGRNDDDEFTITCQFGQGTGGMGIKCDGLPGVTGSLVGPVERTLTAPNNVRVFSGLRSDPFFFDVIGFRETLSTGNLAIQNTRDFFRDGNDTTIAVQIPLNVTGVGTDSNADGKVDNRMDIWVQTFRKGGQI